jgi:Mg2+ and Co2+ transporter CorA
VEDGPSRRLLQELNNYTEEVGIILQVKKEQCEVLSALRETLNPASYTKVDPLRHMQFRREEKFINDLILDILKQLQDYDELRKRALRLTIENVQLVETEQDENSTAILLFTIVTIIFLPLTFVTAFFGMDLVMRSTGSSTTHFWVVAGPLTAGVAIFCGIIKYRTKLFMPIKNLWWVVKKKRN